MEGVETVIGRADVDDAVCYGRRRVDKAASLVAPAFLATGSINGIEAVVSGADVDETVSYHG